MPRGLFFLVLFRCCSGVSSQPTLTQPASVSVSLGQTAKVSCSRNGGNKWDGFHWFQQRPGEAPLFLWYGTSRRTGISDRFTGSVSDNMGYLTISNIQAADEAVYYCCDWEYSIIQGFIFGAGTHLTVLGQPTVHPTVNVFPPSPEELKGDKATLVCLMDGFYPGVVQVTWEGDGTPISSGVETTKPSKLNDKYVASSYLSMTKNDWERYDEVTCKVAHEGKTFPKVVKRMECA